MSAYAPSTYKDELHACPYCGSPARLVEKACIEEQGGLVYTGYAVACTNDNQYVHEGFAIPACALSRASEFEFSVTHEKATTISRWSHFVTYTERIRGERALRRLGTLDPQDRSDYQDMLIVTSIAQRHARKLLTRKKS